MRFVLDAEQQMFGESLHKMLSGADPVTAIRAGTFRELWAPLAEAGVFALAVPQACDGAGVLPVELVVAFLELGRHAVPGPLVETVAAAVLLEPVAAQWLPRIASGEAVVSLARPYALDAGQADLVLAVDAGKLHTAMPVEELASLDPARRLFKVSPTSVLGKVDPGRAFDLATLACAAQQLGLGRALLETTAEYAKTRQQFGRPIGEFQAIKHHLATALVKLEFAQPLLFGAALSYGTETFARDVSAAKVACAEASYTTAKIALQVHGAIGYTDEYDPSLWIRKARALYTAWGTPAEHRARVLA